jgi:spore coat polysaccharide biosynthesis predicted glycosyltransferase SpsG
MLMNNKKKVFIFTAAYRTIGSGHLQRSKILKKILSKFKYKSKILCFNRKNQGKIFNYLNYATKNDINIILDFSNKLFFYNNFFLKNLTNSINNSKKKILIIDSLGKDFLTKFLKTKKLINIVPYFSKIKRNRFQYSGPKYFVFNEGLKSITNRKISKIKNILITFGGSDLKNSTIKFTKLLLKNFPNIKIKVIIGPYFEKKQIKDIKKVKKNNKNLSTSYFKDNFFKNINDAEIIITSTGLTKYEMCLTSRHIIVYSENKKNYTISNNFAKKNITINLSFKDNNKKLKNIMNNLINNPGRFNHIIKNRKNFFDFNAPKRILSIIKKNEK